MLGLDATVHEGALRVLHILFHSDVAGLPQLTTDYANGILGTTVDPQRDATDALWVQRQEDGAVLMLLEAARLLVAGDDEDVDAGDPEWLKYRG